MARLKQTAKRIVDPQEDSQEESYNPATDGRKRAVVSRGGASKRGRTETGGASGSRGGPALGRGKGKGLACPPTPQHVTSEEEVSATGSGSAPGSGSGSEDEATESEEELQQQAQQQAEESESEGEQAKQQQIYMGPSRSFRAGRIYMMLLPTVTATAGASVPYYQGDVCRYR